MTVPSEEERTQRLLRDCVPGPQESEHFSQSDHISQDATLHCDGFWQTSVSVAGPVHASVRKACLVLPKLVLEIKPSHRRLLLLIPPSEHGWVAVQGDHSLQEFHSAMFSSSATYQYVTLWFVGNYLSRNPKKNLITVYFVYSLLRQVAILLEVSRCFPFFPSEWHLGSSSIPALCIQT